MPKCAKKATSAARMACVDAVTKAEEAKKRQGKEPKQNYGSGGGSGGGGGGSRRTPASAPQRTWEYSLRANTRIEGLSATYRPTMVFRCTYGEMLGYVRVGMAVEPDRVSHSAVYTDAIFQVDQERAFRLELRVSETGNRLYIPSPIEFSSRVSGKDSLTIQVTPQNAEPAETTFDLKHFEEGMAPLRKACPW